MEKHTKELEVTGVTLITKDEYERVRGVIPQIRANWWLMCEGSPLSLTPFIDKKGEVDHADADHYIGVRPVLTLASSDLSIGDKVKIGRYSWTAIGKSKVICDEIIFDAPYYEYIDDEETVEYNNSDLKRWINPWFEESLF